MAVHLEGHVSRTDLYEARIAPSKSALGFFNLLISSAVIASLGLTSNSTEVVIVPMVISHLMKPILSLAFAFDDLDINTSVIPNRVYKFDNQTMN